ncbi:hypothetical protein TNCV_2465851 [Trichonephila clavipes]|uniref:Uncharacterized protein n=1 Tax=Trichonephila clavipes TaxID=2585209 RepID=A0A8X6UXG5_TRICX|nr:hypothetical protein TNCV_2465851 [Trichonephila clavipes]
MNCEDCEYFNKRDMNCEDCEYFNKRDMNCEDCEYFNKRDMNCEDCEYFNKRDMDCKDCVNTATNAIWTVNICVCISLDTYLPVHVEGSSTKEKKRKEDLINVLKEIGEQATSKETIIELKTKLEKSAAFKDDPDFVINVLNLSVEDRQAKAERQLQETNSQLELKKKLNYSKLNEKLNFRKLWQKGKQHNKVQKEIQII